jgi:serine/threonine protein kinase
LVSVLGRGGYGITYRARDTVLGREVAIKEYLPTSLALRVRGAAVVPRSTKHVKDFIWGRERFLEEARILATLDHVPAVVHVHDFMEAHGTAYMVMGLVRGETLEERLERDKRLPSHIVERMLSRLLDGLEAVHKAGVLHRDIKPANVMLDSNDDSILIDFGAARASMVDRTASMTAVFTPRYAAIEQQMEPPGKLGPWTDIYCLSATIYHAVTGSPPPTSMTRALNDTCEPLVAMTPGNYPSRLLQGIDAGLSVWAKDRPQSIDSWRRLLTRAVHDDETISISAGDSTLKIEAADLPTSEAATKPVEQQQTPAAVSVVDERRGPAPSIPTIESRRTLLYGGVALAVILLGAGGYWAFASMSVSAVVLKPKTVQEANLTAAAETRQRAEATTRQQAETDAKQKAEAEVRQRETEARQRAEVEARQRAEAAAAKQKVEAEIRRKTEAVPTPSVPVASGPEGGKSGRIQVILTWDNTSDLDLEVVCPSGDKIDFKTPSSCGGRLDVDRNASAPTRNPVENIVFEREPPPGRYEIYVSHQFKPGPSAPSTTPFRVMLRQEGLLDRVYKGVMVPWQRSHLGSFDVPPRR